MEEKFTRKPTQDNFVSEKIDIIKNNLLGTYDNNGNYNIAPQIVNELLMMKKHRKSSYDNSMFCTGHLFGYGEIVFQVTFDKGNEENTQAKALLYVLEDVDKINGYIQNTIKTLIAEFNSNVENFIEESYTKFNITDENEDNDEDGKERKLSDLELDDSYILAKKAFMLNLDKLENDRLLDAYGKLFTEKFSLFSTMDNEFGKAVVELFNTQYAAIEKFFLKEKNYKALNELLDACVEQISGTNPIFEEQEKQYNEKIANAINNFGRTVEQINLKSEQKAMNMLEKTDRDKLKEMNETSADLEANQFGDNDGETVAEDELISNILQDQSMDENSPIIDNPMLYEDLEASQQEGSSEESVQESNEVDEQQEQQLIEEVMAGSSEVADSTSIMDNQTANELVDNVAEHSEIETTHTNDVVMEESLIDDILADAAEEDKISNEEFNKRLEEEKANVVESESSVHEFASKSYATQEVKEAITPVEQSKSNENYEDLELEEGYTSPTLESVLAGNNKEHSASVEQSATTPSVEIKETQNVETNLENKVESETPNKTNEQESSTQQTQTEAPKYSEKVQSMFDFIQNKLRSETRQQTSESTSSESSSTTSSSDDAWKQHIEQTTSGLNDKFDQLSSMVYKRPASNMDVQNTEIFKVEEPIVQQTAPVSPVIETTFAQEIPTSVVEQPYVPPIDLTPMQEELSQPVSNPTQLIRDDEVDLRDFGDPVPVGDLPNGNYGNLPNVSMPGVTSTTEQSAATPSNDVGTQELEEDDLDFSSTIFNVESNAENDKSMDSMDNVELTGFNGQSGALEPDKLYGMDGRTF